MNYIGSKLSLLDFLSESIEKVTGGKKGVFCDLFAGTGAVGSYFKRKGYKIVANDIQYYSYVLNKHYIQNHKQLLFQGLLNDILDLDNVEIRQRKELVISYLSSLPGRKGFVFNNYCLGGSVNQSYKRQYFSDDNGKKIDAIRSEIENWKKLGKVNDGEYYFLLASLLESVDKVANTASVYGAFLKHLKTSASKQVVLQPAELIVNDNEHDVYNDDVNELIRKINGDILYLDPPYNQRQYATNYHVLETIAKYDKPKIYGKTGLRNYEKEKSKYCSRSQVRKAFEDLIMNAKVKYIFLSYNNEGLLSPAEIKNIMSQRGKYGYFKRSYSRFKADKDSRRDFKATKTTEFLHYVVCK